MASQIEIRIFEKEGRDGNPYMIGSARVPASIKLSEVTFVIFYPEEGSEEGTLVIRPNRRSATPRNYSQSEQYSTHERNSQ